MLDGPAGLVLHDLVLGGLVLGGLALDGLALDGLALDGLALDGLALDGLALDGLALDGLALDGLALGGLALGGLAPGGLVPSRRLPNAHHRYPRVASRRFPHHHGHYDVGPIPTRPKVHHVDHVGHHPHGRAAHLGPPPPRHHRGLNLGLPPMHDLGHARSTSRGRLLSCRRGAIVIRRRRQLRCPSGHGRHLCHRADDGHSVHLGRQTHSHRYRESRRRHRVGRHHHSRDIVESRHTQVGLLCAPYDGRCRTWSQCFDVEEAGRSLGWYEKI